MRKPTITPPEMVIFLGGAACTLGGAPLPKMLSLTPPATPPPRPSMPATPKPLDGGASFSVTCRIVCGIRVGAVSWLFIISD
jgi:hypothetical protein